MKAHLYFAALFATFSALFFVSAARAQDDEPGAGRQRLEHYRHVKMIEALDLNEEQAVRLFAREKEFRQAEKERMDQRQDILARIRSLAKGSPTESELLKEIQALNDGAIELARARQDYVLGLKDILSTKQIAKLVIFEDTFMREVRKMLQSAKGKRMRDR